MLKIGITPKLLNLVLLQEVQKRFGKDLFQWKYQSFQFKASTFFLLFVK